MDRSKFSPFSRKGLLKKISDVSSESLGIPVPPPCEQRALLSFFSKRFCIERGEKQ